MTKYSGVWTPDMGDGDEPQKDAGKPLPPNRYQSSQFQTYRERQEAKDRTAAWMRGLEPVEQWEQIGGGAMDFILYMTFPMTEHEVICFDLWSAYDTLKKAERLRDWGRLVIWCFGCRGNDCAACRLTEREFRKGLKVKWTLTKDDDNDGLPF